MKLRILLGITISILLWWISGEDFVLERSTEMVSHVLIVILITSISISYPFKYFWEKE